MSEIIRVSGKTLEDAITNATIRLGVTSDSIVYTVIEHESKGFLGIGQKDAVIEVRVKTEADFEAERLKKKAEEDAAAGKDISEEEAASKEEGAAGSAEVLEEKTEEKAKEKTEETENPERIPNEEESGESEENTSAPSRKREREIRPLENPQEAIDKAEGFLRDVYSAMGMDVELISNYDGEVLNVQMNGDDMGLLMKKLKEADFVIHSYPLYFFGMPGAFKTFIDRMLGMFETYKGFMPAPDEGLSHRFRDTDKEQHFAVISSCGFSEGEEVFAPLRGQYDLIYGRGNYTAIFCPQIKALVEAGSTHRLEAFTGMAEKAGRMFMQQGFIDEETAAELSKPWFSKKTYRILAERFWQEQKEAGGKNS